eukprot:CAMPEP_0113846386 /NCGR_PEP_ID=MMETSP0372-20130328/1279_1 /TAXON_ID=340204 /ORGANISM="Lankesteria abbotti" /LENGTH=285 /DNA_ID=CAMNT_0000815525 /DNA_START=20 /DNA_END=877 /DNA_ORIENTATION=+ /assembly_acc=CAM_ASM_000359
MAEAVYCALKVGFRHVDCAHVYGNEKGVGAGLQRSIKEGIVKRSEVFVTSKLWINNYHPMRAKAQLLQTLKDLQLEYVDQFLMHWPFALPPGDEKMPLNADGLLPVDTKFDIATTWQILEDCYREGLVRSIGVSNFQISHLEHIMQNGSVKPAVNQVECHPYLPQTKLREFMKVQNIALVAYRPLATKRASDSGISALRDPFVASVAEELKKTPAQVLLAWSLHMGNVAIPKSSNPSRLQENMDCLEVHLSDEHMAKINSITLRHRIVLLPFPTKSGPWTDADNN